jgi:hypothetical protein
MWLVHMYMCVSNICHGGGNGLEMLQSLHMWWWKSLLHMRHNMESCDQGGEDQDKAWLENWLQVWRASQRLWSEGSHVMVKLKQDLASMDRRNGEEQVRSRLMNQYSHVMIWSGSYHLVIGWCLCCINIEGDGMKCARQRYNLGNFISLVEGCVEKFITGFRIDGRTIKRGKLVCISVVWCHSSDLTMHRC